MNTQTQTLRAFWAAALACAILVMSARAPAAELLTLGPETYAGAAPQGLQANAVFGDFVLRNDRVTACIAGIDHITGRSARRWGTTNVAGMLIDFTRNGRQNDQLLAFYAGRPRYKPDAPQDANGFADEAEICRRPDRQPQRAGRVTLRIPPILTTDGRPLAEIAALPAARRPAPVPTVEYLWHLEDGWEYLLVEAVYHNPTDKPQAVRHGLELRLYPHAATGLSADGMLWADDSAWRQAYAVQPLHGRFGGRRGNQAWYAADAGEELALEPGASRTVAFRIAVGDSLFEAMQGLRQAAGAETRQLELLVRDAAGPVPDCLVTATRDGAVVGRGWTDAAGRLQAAVTPGSLDLEISHPARPVVKVTAPAAAAAPLEVVLGAAGRVVAEISDDNGRPLPCRIQFFGVDGTPNPEFFNDTGELLVRNLANTPDGRCRAELRPGTYEVLVSRGPEYDILRRRLNVEAGRETVLREKLSRLVDTGNWIAVDLHSHTAVSGETQIVYLSSNPPYVKDTSVDGDCYASPRGRLLSLAAEGIVFAPATEHNVAFDYGPEIAALGLGGWLATAPGVGMTAGRRHALQHVQAFPVGYRPGAMDGGIRQRPQHTNLLRWMQEWPGRPEMLLVAAIPRQYRELAIQAGMDALDIQDLLPLVHGKPVMVSDNRALQWLDSFKAGYRLPGVVASGTFNNFAGGGHPRVYVPVRSPQPGKLDPGDIVKAVRRGEVLMTTGPFVEVHAFAPGKPGQGAGMGAEIAAPDGRIELRVGVRCPGWMQPDRVQVLVNGERRPELYFTRHSRPEFFHAAGEVFREKLPLTLEKDSFLVVVVSGTGANLRPGANPQSQTAQIAVTNPIFVDVGGDGYEPHSPLDDKVQTEISWVRPLLARKDAPPGIFRVLLRNTGDRPARDKLSIRTDPEGMLDFLEPAEIAYEIPPRGEVMVPFRAVFSDKFLARGLPLITVSYTNPAPRILVPRSGAGLGRRPAARPVQVHHSAWQFDPVETLDDAKKVLAQADVYPVTARSGRRLADLRFGFAGDRLALHARVYDRGVRRGEPVWQGSCIEIFGSNGAEEKKRQIGQCYLLPAAGDLPAAASLQRGGGIQPVADVQVASQNTADGYELVALLPEKHLPINPAGTLVLLEFRVTAHPAPGAAPETGAVFRSGAPHVDIGQYGRIRLQGKVDAEFEVLNPPGPTAEAAPGRLRLTLKNVSSTPARDTVTLQLSPAEAAMVRGASAVAYSLAPGESSRHEFEIALRPGAGAGVVEAWLETSPRREVFATIREELPVTPRPLATLPATVLDLATAGEIAATGLEYEIRSAAGNPLGKICFAVAGGRLVLEAEVKDPAPRRDDIIWKGSCLEVFGAVPSHGVPAIGQVFLAPAADGKAAAVFVKDGDEFVPAPGAEVASSLTEDGYRLHALLPLELLQIGPAGPLISLEFQATVAGAGGKPVHGSAFNSRTAYMDASRYCRFILEKPGGK